MFIDKNPLKYHLPFILTINRYIPFSIYFNNLAQSVLLMLYVNANLHIYAADTAVYCCAVTQDKAAKYSQCSSNKSLFIKTFEQHFQNGIDAVHKVKEIATHFTAGNENRYFVHL